MSDASAAPKDGARPDIIASTETRRSPLLRGARRRVVMADVDAARILYFGTPFRWFEELFTLWLQSIGHSAGHMLSTGVSTPVVASHCEYLRPIGLDDLVDLELRAGAIGERSFSVHGFAVKENERGSALQFEAAHVWVEFDELDHGVALRAKPLPSWLRSSLREEQFPDAGTE